MAGRAKRNIKQEVMKTQNVHWTEWSVDDFAHSLTFDFVTQISNELEKRQCSHAALAEKLGVTDSRVSQMLNSPDTISLKNAVKYARAIGRKVALVIYDDKDPTNRNGPVSSQIFSRCWENSGKPTDFFQLKTATTSQKTCYIFLSTQPTRCATFWPSFDSNSGLLAHGSLVELPIGPMQAFTSGTSLRIQ